MLDEPICDFRGVGSILSLLFYFRWKILSANNVDPDQTAHYWLINLNWTNIDSKNNPEKINTDEVIGRLLSWWTTDTTITTILTVNITILKQNNLVPERKLDISQVFQG